MSNTAEGEDANFESIREVGFGVCKVPCNMTYITSLSGVLTAAEMIVSMIGLITVASVDRPECEFLYSSTYGYYEFVTVTWMILCLVRYIMFCLTLYRRLCFKIVPWILLEIVLCLVFSVMFLIAASVVASHVCWQDGYRAGAAFGFICLILMIVDIVYMFIRIRREYPPTTNRLMIAMGAPAMSQQERSPPQDFSPEWDPATKY